MVIYATVCVDLESFVARCTYLHLAFIEMPFGFDTATKVAAQLVGNIAIDCASNKKYWYFIRVMGRAPSHFVLEVCAVLLFLSAVLCLAY